jgi:putative peptidoglycan lipid II flippase
VRQALRLQLPIFLGLLVSTIAIIVDRNLAWRAEADAIGAMRYATTLVQFVLGIVAAAISLAALPTLADHFTRGDDGAFRATLERALAMVTVLIVPAVLGLAALARPVVDLLFQHGQTDSDGARLISIALLGYLPGTLCAAYDQVLIYAFYARRNTLWPVVVGVAATSVYFAVALSAGRRYGMIGLVAANSLQFAAHVAIMLVLVRREIGPVWTRRLRVTVRQSATAAALMAGAALVLWLMAAALWPEPGGGAARAARELALFAFPAGVGALCYIALLTRWRSEELAMIQRATWGRVAGRFGG